MVAKASKLARATDPETSHEAATEHVESGQNEAQRTLVLAAVRRHGGRTSDELAAILKVDRYIVARRLPELEADGLVERGIPRRSSITGRRGLTWEAVEM